MKFLAILLTQRTRRPSPSLLHPTRLLRTSHFRSYMTEYFFFHSQCLDLNAVDSLGKTPLFWSVMHGIPEITRLLLEHGADINKATLPTRSLLHWAAWQGNDEVIQCLLENGEAWEKAASSCRL